MTLKPRRSVLYMPGDKPRALEKARTLAADALILDLEDSVAPEQKAEARRLVSEAVRAGGFGRRDVTIRVNSLATPWARDDFAMAVAAGPDAILVPKVASAGGLVQAAALAKGTALWAMIETPLAILNLGEIGGAAAAHKLSCLVIGTNDLVKESRMSAGANRFALVPALSQSVLAARAFGLSCIDGVFNDIKDADGFAAECEQGKMLGMDGKTLIHPSQIEPCNKAFSPSPEDVAWARNVVAVFARRENAGKGVVAHEGRMVERLHLDMAKHILAIAEAVAEAATEVAIETVAETAS
jgi:citrate lyase subunit beta / citryl-CoA lyase